MQHDGKKLATLNRSSRNGTTRRSGDMISVTKENYPTDVNNEMVGPWDTLTIIVFKVE